MNPLQAKQLVDEWVAMEEPDEGSTSDQITAAMNDSHDQMLIVDAALRRIALDICTQAPLEFDVHSHPVGLKVPEEIEQSTADEVMHAVVAYVCGDPRNFTHAITGMFNQDTARDSAAFGFLMALLWQAGNGQSPLILEDVA